MSERILLERGVGATMRDGTVLMADVYRPDDGDRHPVLLQRTPYDRTFSPLTWMMADPTRLAAAGYAVVIQDVRGRFGSGGEYSGPYAEDVTDGVDTVAWCASQPWSDGNVGMYGVSYMGGVQWAAASEAPPALRAIAPTMSAMDGGDHHLHRGGALQLGLMATWHLTAVAPHALIRSLGGDIPQLLAEFPRLLDDIDSLEEHMRALPLAPFAPLADRGIAPGLSDAIAEDHLAQTEMPGPRQERIHVPAMQIAGWYDLMLQWNLDGHVAMRERAASDEARRHTRLIVGPWGHPAPAFTNQVGEIDFGVRSAGYLLEGREDLTTLHRRWFDARLRGMPSGIDDEQPVKIFVMGRNRWRSEDEWPLRRARAERWHVHGDGTLSPRPPADDAPSVFTLDPDDPVPTTGGNILMTQRYARGPKDQAATEARPDVLVFTSEPLTTDLEVTGRITFTCWLAADTVDTDVVARLCDVHPDGRSFNVVDGIQRLRFRKGLGAPEPLTPGEVVMAEVDLWSTSHVFLAGHALRLQVCASDFPRYDRCPGTGESSATAKQVVFQRNRLFHDPQRPSHLTLPVVPG